VTARLPVWHFYHLHAGGAWLPAVREHVAATQSAGLPGPMLTGLAGPPQRRGEVARFLDEHLGAGAWEPVAQADEGFEQVTLTVLREWVHAHAGEAAVLYAHTKGASSTSANQDTWRASMTRHAVTGWRGCVALLGTYDAVGCHWTLPGHYCDTAPCFAGNFWWARASYLRTLPEVGMADRGDAERWLGLGSPRVFDLFPGWPSEVLYA
jgi:hypothetical protein